MWRLANFCCIAGLSVCSLGSAAAAPAPSDAGLRVCPPAAAISPACPFTSLQAALDEAMPGQTITIAPGTYREGVRVAVPGVTIRGEPGAHFKETVYRGKGIFTVKAKDVTIEGIAFSNARARDGNGAAIRLETSRVTVRNNTFRDNEMHILGGTEGADGRIVIEGNEMISTRPSSNFNHSVYISKKVEGSLIFRANSVIATRGLGHGLKTGAGTNRIEDNVIAQLDGDGSLCIDIVIGGHSVIRNNLCQAGPNRDNANLIGIGLTKRRDDYPKARPNFTLIEDNIFIVDGARAERTCLLLSGTAGTIEIRDNILVGVNGGCRGLSDPLGARVDYIIGLPLNAERSNNQIFDDRQSAGLPAYPALPSD